MLGDMGRVSNTVELAKASWSVLQADKELMVFPVMSMVATILVAVSFVVPVLTFGGFDGQDLTVVDYAIIFAFYIVAAFVTIFFNASLVHAANERLHGGDPTLGSAMRGAGSRLNRILPWALVSATVSIVLRAIEERLGGLGRLIAGLAGLAWSLVTYLVIPILVIEDIGVVDGVKRSAALFRRTWGENVTAQFGFGILGFVASLPGVMVAVLGVLAGGAFGILGLVLGVLWIVLVAVVLTALNGIFQTALYHYAVNGEVPGDFFSEQAFASAFVPKKKRGGWLR